MLRDPDHTRGWGRELAIQGMSTDRKMLKSRKNDDIMRSWVMVDRSGQGLGEDSIVTLDLVCSPRAPK
jgi:hypothetical protein